MAAIVKYFWEIAKAILPWILKNESVKIWWCNARFVSPQDHWKVDRGTFLMHGSYSHLVYPKFVIFHIEGDNYYYHRHVSIDKPRKRWSKEIRCADMPGVEYTFVLCAIDEQWSILVDYYIDVNLDHATRCNNPDIWTPIHVRPGDTPGLVELDRIRVTTK